jgi:hypothetical protein
VRHYLPFMLVALTFFWPTVPVAVGAAEPKPDLSELEGKKLLLFLKTHDQRYGLEKVELRTLGKRAFLVGKRLYLGDGKEGEAGYPVWIPVDDVLSFHVFNTIDELKKSRGGKNAALQYQELAPKAEPPIPLAQPVSHGSGNHDGWRWDWALIVVLVGIVMFVGGRFVGLRRNRG